jgi:lambda family phage portal protein
MTDALSDGFRTPTAEAAPYDAARTQGRRVRAWRVPGSGPNAAVTYALGTIRNRARAAARNDPWGGAALDKLTSNGIGTGIQAKGLYGDGAYRKAEKKLWRTWCKQCDADGVLDFYGLQGLAWREFHEAGEIFVRLRPRRPTDGLAVPLQVQLIEAEQCPADYYATASNGNPIRAGIEFNAIGQRVAYWMYREHPGEYQTGTNGGELVRVPAEQILHVYEPLRAGQLRGIPRATSVLLRMFNLDSLDDAVLERHKIANLFAVFYKQVTGDELPPGMVAEMQNGAGSVDVDDVPLAGLEPGTAQELPPGLEPVFANPPQAGTDYAEYVRGHLMAIAARHNVPYEVLTGDLRNISDRALRLILNEFRRVLEMWQWLLFIPRFCQPIREAYLDAAVLAAALQVDGYADVREDVFETLWVPQGWPYSHPVQDVDADTKAVRSGFKSRSSVVLSNGDDPEAVDAEQAQDNARADAQGLKYESDGRQQKVAAAPAPQQPQNDTNPGDPTHAE